MSQKDFVETTTQIILRSGKSLQSLKKLAILPSLSLHNVRNWSPWLIPQKNLRITPAKTASKHSSQCNCRSRSRTKTSFSLPMQAGKRTKRFGILPFRKGVSTTTFLAVRETPCDVKFIEINIEYGTSVGGWRAHNPFPWELLRLGTCGPSSWKIQTKSGFYSFYIKNFSLVWAKWACLSIPTLNTALTLYTNISISLSALYKYSFHGKMKYNL